MSRVLELGKDQRESTWNGRRKGPRYRFHAAIKVEDRESGECIEAQVSVLSYHGCYVITREPFPLGTQVNATISKDGLSWACMARVVSSQEHGGMGLLFFETDTESARILSKWFTDARESESPGFCRRRSQRVLMRVPLRISTCQGVEPTIEEETEAVVISAHGALVLLSRALKNGDMVSVINRQTGAAAECSVVHIGEVQCDKIEVGVEFLSPNPSFWNVVFPPQNWSPGHPAAKNADEPEIA